MKVLMLGKIGLLDSRGGDRIQIENTARELKALGIDVDISCGLEQNYQNYDLVHVFQLDWKPECYFYVKGAKDCGKPVVLSPIHHNVSELKKFDDTYVFDFRRISRVLFKDQFSRDTFKNIYTALFSPKHIKPTLYSVFAGLKNMHTRALQMSDYIIVQTKLEAADLVQTYGVDIRWEKVPNGVSENFLNVSDTLPNIVGLTDYIVCVGRIEPRKNQLSIVKAVSRLRDELNKDIKLVFIGNQSGYKHYEYNYYFNKALKDNSWIKHISSVPYEQMPSVYKYAKVCVSASWFETTGLTVLEAMFCGANAVASGDRAHEYLGETASYCKPDDLNSITSALKKEYLAERPVIDGTLKKEYTWKNAAVKTLNVYKQVLKD